MTLKYRLSEIHLDGEKGGGCCRTEFLVPIRTVSPANLREHWRARAARVKRERMAVALCFPRGIAIPLPCTVELTRLAPRRNLIKDGDNLTASQKGTRDEIARQLGVDDSDPRVRWAPVLQQAGTWGLWVVITSTLGEPMPEATAPAVSPAPRLLERAQGQAGYRVTPAFIAPPKKEGT